MSEEYRKPEYSSIEDEGLGIDFMAIFAKLLKRWKFILVVSCIFGVLGIISALTMQRKWNVSMTLAPEFQRTTSSSVATIASMMGMNMSNMNSSADALNITLFPEICSSTPFLTQLFDVPVQPYISPSKLAEGAKEPPVTTVYNHVLGLDKPKKGLSKWLSRGKDEESFEDDSVLNPQSLTYNQHNVMKALRQSISVNVNNKTGVTNISVTMDDRRIVTQVADTVCKMLQNYVIDYRTKKAKSDYDYYVKLADEAHEKLVKAQAAYAARVDYDRGVILQSVNSVRQRLQEEANLANQVYTQMVQQREMAKAKIQEAKPVYAVVQPATMPQFPMNSRKSRVFVFGFLGFFLACAWVAFGEDFLEKIKSQVKQETEE
ncbi:MAG: hypothetical protein J6S64_04085 [Bacteroidales bacterium]|nr:hypothetical protein [Bacteroidales bacterium]